MPIGNHPYLNRKEWSGEIEIRGGDIHDFYADCTIQFTQDGGEISVDSWQILVREKIKINGEEVEIKIDYTNRVKEETMI